MSSKNEGENPFGAINFGEFRKYMQNKKSKLKMQEKEVQDQASQELPQIFSGTSIYINGFTNPASNELRRMILQHGGDYQHYLKKLSVTHIIATNLTNSKVEEFRAYKVVKPTWITESIEAGKLLPWQNYRLVSTLSKQKELVVSRGESLNAQILATEKSRAMSTANPEFLDRFYKSSRLHYLSTWKSELKDIVERLEEEKANNVHSSKKRKKNNGPRIVMHVDFDCFFASVGIKDRPHLINKPVAVSHSTNPNEQSSSDIASCNYVARSFGLKNGMMIGKAKSICPQLQVIPYEFDKYKAISTMFYEILFRYADKMQAISVDEALLEFESLSIDEVEVFAAKIRKEIKKATGCDASIGVGSNVLLARMSTKKAKPAGQYYCKTQDDIDDLLSGQSVTQLPGVGYAIREKLRDMNVEFVSDLKEIPLHELQSKLGSKMGKTLYEYSRGIDNQPLVTHKKRASVSAEVNWGVRFLNEENECEFVFNLSKEVSNRLQKHKVKGKSITLKCLKRKEDATEATKHLGHGLVDSYSKSSALNDYTDDPEVINRHAYSLLKSFHFSYADIRGLGIHISKLDNQEDSVSPDQGKLDFAIQKNYPPTTIDNEALPIQNATDKATPTTTKRDLVVDYAIYKELPDSVQKELAAEFGIVFQEVKPIEKETTSIQETSIIDTQSSSQLLADLPPWSQLDPSALLALPDKMREQVLKAYEKQQQNNHPSNKQVVSKPPVSPHRTPSTSSARKSRGKNTSIAHMLKHGSPSSHGSSPRRPKSDSQVKSLFKTFQFDEEVWNELPESVQMELLGEHRKTRDQQELEQAHKAHINSRSSHPNKVALVYLEEPSLQGVTDIDEIRRLLKDWLSLDEYEEEDISTVSAYLIALVEQSYIEKTKLLLAYLKYRADSEQRGRVVQQIQETVDEVMTQHYGCKLHQFY